MRGILSSARGLFAIGVIASSIGLLNQSSALAFDIGWGNSPDSVGFTIPNADMLETESLSVNNVVQVPLLHVTSDAIPGFLDIQLLLDSNTYNLYAGVLATDDGKRKVFKPEEMPNGVVLERRSGKDIATLVSRDLDLQNGGNLDLIYLSNGVTGSKGTFQMQIVRSGNQWYLQTPQGQAFANMYLKGRFWLGKAVGIKSVHIQ